MALRIATLVILLVTSAIPPLLAAETKYTKMPVKPLEWRSKARCDSTTLVINGQQVDHRAKSVVRLEALDESRTKLDIQLKGKNCDKSVGGHYGNIDCQKKRRILTATAEEDVLVVSVDVGLWGNASCTIFETTEPNF